MQPQPNRPSWPRIVMLLGFFLLLLGACWLFWLSTRPSTETVSADRAPLRAVDANGETAVAGSSEDGSAPMSQPVFVVDGDLGTGSVEFSAVTVNEDLGRLLIADDGDWLYEFDLDPTGRPVVPPRRSIEVTAGSGDLEGVAWMFDRTYVLAQENDGSLLVVEINDGDSAVDQGNVTRVIPTGVAEQDGAGLEGVAYVGGTSAEFAIVRERPAELCLIDNDGVVGESISLQDSLGITDVADVWSDGPGRYTVVSDESALVVSFELEGPNQRSPDVITTQSLRFEHEGQRGAFQQAEGVARSADGSRLYVVGEQPGLNQFTFGLWETEEGEAAP